MSAENVNVEINIVSVLIICKGNVFYFPGG